MSCQKNQVDLQEVKKIFQKYVKNMQRRGLQEKLKPRFLSEKYGIHRNTVSRWIQQINDRGFIQDVKRGPKHQRCIDERVCCYYERVFSLFNNEFYSFTEEQKNFFNLLLWSAILFRQISNRTSLVMSTSLFIDYWDFDLNCDFIKRLNKYINIRVNDNSLYLDLKEQREAKLVTKKISKLKGVWTEYTSKPYNIFLPFSGLPYNICRLIEYKMYKNTDCVSIANIYKTLSGGPGFPKYSDSRQLYSDLNMLQHLGIITNYKNSKCYITRKDSKLFKNYNNTVGHLTITFADNSTIYEIIKSRALKRNKKLLDYIIKYSNNEVQFPL